MDVKPEEIYIGRSAFEGYVVFCYQLQATAVLECPKVGNAIYFMPLTEWKFLTRLSKTELLSEHNGEVERIIHGDFWRSDLKYQMRKRGIA